MKSKSSKFLKPHFNGLPEELKRHPYWAVWKGVPRDNGKFSKPPINPKTGQYLKPNSTDGWVSFKEAKKAYKRGAYDGVGILLTEKDSFMCIDIDGCRDGDFLSFDAADIVDMLRTYTEISPSGDGLHLIASRGNKKVEITTNKSNSIECYVKDRFLTITGRIYAVNE